MIVPNEIEMLLSSWTQAIKEADVDLLMSLCTADFTVISAGAPPFAGRETMRKVYTHVFAETKVSHTSTIEDVRVDGMLAVVASVERVTLQPRSGGEAKMLELRQMAMLVREAEGWKYARILNNMLRPEEAA
jgi:uncharacterized protein (TIGR02246 family)